MSLSIDSRSITAVYALGQWFEIEPDSFGTDAFDLVCWMGDADDVAEYGEDIERDVYSMGALYTSNEPEYQSRRSPGSRATFLNPRGNVGVCFIEKSTGQRISLSIIEIRAFREDRKLLS